MGQLTWREMQAPDLGTSLRGFQQFTSLLDSALGRAQGAVDRIDANMNERANTGALRIAAAVQDPEQAKTLLTDPRLMNDRVSAATIGALAARPGQLINQAAAETNLADLKRESGYATAFDALMPDALKIRELRRAEGAGTLGEEGRAQLSGLEASLTQRAGAAGAKNALLLAGNLDDAETGALNRAGARLGMDQTRLGMEQTRQNMNQSATSFGWQVEDRNDQKLGQAAFLQISNSSMSKEQALAAFNSGELSRLPPGAKMVALQQLNGTWGNIFTPEQMGEMSGFTGSGSANGGGGDYRGFMGSLENASGNPNARNPNSSASGLYQFTDGTWLSTIKKANPEWARGKSNAELLSLKNQPRYQDMVETAFRSDNAERLRAAGLPVSNANLYSMHHFGNTKFARASNDTPISEILSPEQIAANPYVRGKTKGQVLQNWASRTGGGSPLSVQAGAALTRGQERMGSTSASAMLKAASEETGNILDAVDTLPKNRFGGVSQDFLAKQIQGIVDQGKGAITYRQAALMLNNSLTRPSQLKAYAEESKSDSWFKLRSAGNPFDQRRLNADIEKASRRNGVTEGVVREADIDQGMATMQAAQAALTRAQQEYRATSERRAVQPGVEQQLQRLKIKMDRAQAAYNLSVAALEGRATPVGRSVGR